MKAVVAIVPLVVLLCGWAPAMGDQVPVIAPIPNVTIALVDTFTYDVDATGDPAPTFSLSFPPAGMTIDPVTGVIQWHPDATQTGGWGVEVLACNTAGCGSTTFIVDVVKSAYTLDISSTEGGSVTTPGEGTFQYPSGTAVNVEATPDPGYRFLWWSGTAVDHDLVASWKSAHTVVSMLRSGTLVAHFEPATTVQHMLTVQATPSPEGGYVWKPGEGKFVYSEGTVVPIIARTGGGYHFEGWSGTAVDAGSVADPTAEETTVTIYASYILQANFAKNSSVWHTLNVHASVGGQVIQPGSAGTFHYPEGATVTLIARPDAGYHFTEWSGTAVDAGRVANRTSANTTVTIMGNYTVKPNFEPGERRSLTISSTTGGQVTTPGQGSFEYEPGTAVSVTAEASSGHAFSHWTGTAVDAGKVADATAANTTVTVDANYTLVAHFVSTGPAARRTLTVSATRGGSVSLPGEGEFEYDDGTDVWIMAQPENMWRFTGWTGTAVTAGKVENPAAARTTVTVDADCTLVANFEPIDASTRHTLTVSSGPGGTVIIPGLGSFIYNAGATAKLVAEAGPMCRFSHWSGSLSSTKISASILMDADGAAHANFVTLLTVLCVDDDAPGDPGPGDPGVSDPAEDGTAEHPYDTIQEAIDVAAARIPVIVRPGIYKEHIDLRGKNILLTGIDPRDSNVRSYPVIDGGGTGTAVTFASGETADCVVQGFVITGGMGQQAGGIYCRGASPTIANCVIVGNRTVDAGGGAIYCVESHAALVNCTVSGNYGGEEGAGLYCHNCQVVLTNSILWGDLPREILVHSGADPNISYCDIAGGASGPGNIDKDPLFASAGHWADPTDAGVAAGPNDPRSAWIAGDFHLSSEAGRWNQDSGEWVQDSRTSPCIDAGDPGSVWTAEPAPNGARINMGGYGGTRKASQSPSR
jgi:hypothetical protein